MTTDTIPAPVLPDAKVPVASPSAPPAGETAVPQVQKPVESADGSSDPESQPDKAPEKPKQTVSERISQIHAQKKAAEADAQMARAEAQRYLRELETLRQQPIDQLPYEQQDAARLRDVMKEERAREKIAEAEARQAAVQGIRANEYQTKLDDARERMPDIDQVMPALMRVPLHEAAAEVIVESDKAAEVTYWLGKNLNEAYRIASLAPHKQAAEIARIEARLSAGPSPRRHSQAPPPPTTISGASSPSAKDPANMSMGEFSTWMKSWKR